MAWFRRTTHDPDELARMKSDIQLLRNTIEAHDRRRREAAAAAVQAPARSETFAGTATEPVATEPTNDEPGAGPALAREPAAIDATDADAADAMAAAARAAEARIDELAAKLGELDARVTAVSTELANQVNELGHDIESLAARPAGEGPDEAVLGELRDGQTRLANEQARYQIAFREDLARLAEQFRRPGAGTDR